MDSISQVRLQQVHPQLGAIIAQMDSSLTMQGIEIRVVQGLRTMAEQAALYAQGRTTPGEIVTDAQPGYSYHNFGTAVDLIPGLRGKTPWEPNWDWQHPDFQTMIRVGIGLGLVSGSTWETFKDYPHFQLPGLTVTPTQDMRDCITQGGLQAFWDEFVG